MFPCVHIDSCTRALTFWNTPPTTAVMFEGPPGAVQQIWVEPMVTDNEQNLIRQSQKHPELVGVSTMRIRMV